MKSIHDTIRERLHQRLGLDNQVTKRDPMLAAAEAKRMSRKLEEIRQLAEPRLVMGSIRYASGWEHEPLMDYMQKKFSEYRKTGNFEMLVDLFNFIAIEGELKTHPLHHFRALDRE